MIKVGILTVTAREIEDGEHRPGSLIKEICEKRLKECKVVAYDFLSGEMDKISKKIEEWVDKEGIDLILTCGGTGIGSSDVVPEATRKTVEREIPGLVEAIRMEGSKISLEALLGREVAGVRKNSLIVNLPGNEKVAKEGLEAVLSAIPAALEMLNKPGR